ncbi:MAG: HAMP domain-containing protein [Burkholderiales bacterium]|nr:HAMP domain-containing protein [Burkholderiales bacterium]
MLLLLVSSAASLLLAMIAIVVYDSYDYAGQRALDLETQAQILGKTSIAALSFNDVAAGSEYLEALRAKPTIVVGAIYTADEKLFAGYSKDRRHHVFPPPEPPGFRFEGGDVLLFHTIENNGEKLGSVYLRADLQRLSRAISYAGIVVLVMAAALAAGVKISARLQGTISAPLMEIARVAQAVIEKKDYALRAKKISDDEIGQLAEAFNLMLSYIQERDARLLAANRSLQAEIDERRQAQEALKHNMQELARSNAELEQFAYVSSHDLQEPLRMVASYTQLLEKRYAERFDEKGLTYLHYIVDGARRMQQLIDDLLMFSRVGTRGKELRPISAREPFSAALQNLKAAIQESRASITGNDLPQVMGDITQLTQLFQNLISNAIKFTKQGMTPQIHIQVTDQNEFWLFAVKDNGIGIDHDHFERIFVIFQRLHGRTEYPGSGIGLAICKKIIERHGGRIWVESQPDKGSTFYFTLRKASR